MNVIYYDKNNPAHTCGFKLYTSSRVNIKSCDDPEVATALRNFIFCVIDSIAATETLPDDVANMLRDMTMVYAQYSMSDLQDDMKLVMSSKDREKSATSVYLPSQIEKWLTEVEEMGINTFQMAVETFEAISNTDEGYLIRYRIYCVPVMTPEQAYYWKLAH